VRRLLLFLVLATGGIVLLVQAAGGLFGESRDAVQPEIPVIDHSPIVADTGESPLRISDYPVNPNGRTPDVAIRPVEDLRFALTRPREWKDSVTGERIALPFFTEMAFHVKHLESFRDASTGAPGERWKDVHVTV
jgi:hypothetical protein